MTVHLAKRGMTPEDVVCGLGETRKGGRDAPKPRPLSKEIVGVGTLYYRDSLHHTPAWATDFFGDTVNDCIFSTSSASAALLVGIDERLFAITFGYGRSLLDMGTMEERFGLKVVLNSCEDPSFRKVNSTSVAGNAGKKAEQLPRLSKLTDFGMDSVTDTLDKVVASASEGDDLFSGAITGGDSLSFSTDQGVETIVTLLSRVLERYKDDSYRDEYPWVDNVAPVKDKSIIEQLEKEAVRLINAKDPRVWTAPPELIDSWDLIARFHLPGCKSVLYDVRIEDVLRSFVNGLTEYRQLRDKFVRAIDCRDGQSELFKWRVSQCLYGEFEYCGDAYCVNAGAWYRVSRDYMKDVNEAYERANLYDSSAFPVCRGMHEGGV